MLRYVVLCYVMLCTDMLCCVVLTALYNNRCGVMTCYVAAGCYVTCVLYYDHMCYDTMLHVLSCTFVYAKHNTNHTGYPALDPTNNEYISGSSWEAMHLCVLCCCSCLMFVSKLVLFCYVFICVVRLYMHKLKSTRRAQQHNIQQPNINRTASRKKTTANITTGCPALDPTKNKCISGSGWELL